MWSGPRNISTAMMRAWENRPDTVVVDEPFYACYLATTGIVHPMQREIMASQSTDWQKVQQQLQADLPSGHTIHYQKHMTHHMVVDVDPQWFGSLKHAFLIRHPAEVVASYAAKRETVTSDDIGYRQQKKLYDLATRSVQSELPVIDARDVLMDPQHSLQQLCDCLGVPFHKNMLSWPAGPRDSDGAWAPHWYGNVEKSTGFGPYQEKEQQLNAAQQRVVDECMPFYEQLYQRRLGAS
ncbi:MAG: HAD family hydrolase [Gammaproteobacteria bacterium]|nr:HAD family hydrolase [Gammaproteobacteria bacterium]